MKLVVLPLKSPGFLVIGLRLPLLPSPSLPPCGWPLPVFWPFFTYLTDYQPFFEYLNLIYIILYIFAIENWRMRMTQAREFREYHCESRQNEIQRSPPFHSPPPNRLPLSCISRSKTRTHKRTPYLNFSLQITDGTKGFEISGRIAKI